MLEITAFGLELDRVSRQCIIGVLAIPTGTLLIRFNRRLGAEHAARATEAERQWLQPVVLRNLHVVYLFVGLGFLAVGISTLMRLIGLGP